MKLFVGNESYLQFYLQSTFTYPYRLKSAVRNTHYCGGDTNTTGGLRLARTEIFNAVNGDRPEVPNVIVLITGSNPSRDTDLLADEVQLIKSLGITIIVVGVGNQVRECAMLTTYPRR